MGEKAKSLLGNAGRFAAWIYCCASRAGPCIGRRLIDFLAVQQFTTGSAFESRTVISPRSTTSSGAVWQLLVKPTSQNRQIHTLYVSSARRIIRRSSGMCFPPSLHNQRNQVRKGGRSALGRRPKRHSHLPAVGSLWMPLARELLLARKAAGQRSRIQRLGPLLMAAKCRCHVSRYATGLPDGLHSLRSVAKLMPGLAGKVTRDRGY
jgi:hypothetical protein